MRTQVPRLVARESSDSTSKADYSRSVNAKLAAMGSLKFLVYAIRKALDTMPQPWEEVRHVTVAHQRQGTFTFILSQTKLNDYDLVHKWAHVCRHIPRDTLPPSYPIFDGSTPYLSYKNNLTLLRPLPSFFSDTLAKPHRLSVGHTGVDATLSVMLGVARRALRNSDSFSIERLVPSIYTHITCACPDDPFLSRSNVYLHYPLTEDQLVAYPALYYPRLIRSPGNLPLFPSPAPSAFCSTFLNSETRNSMSINSVQILSRLVQKHARFDSAQSILQEHAWSIPNIQSLACALRREYTKTKTQHHKSIAQILHTSLHFNIISGVDWLEAAQALLIQAHDAITLIIHRKNVTFFNLDYNFNLTHTKVLSTKERKQSRFGKGFHLVRELAKFLKFIVDTHIAYRLLLIDYPTFVVGIKHLFLNIGTVTSIYRYKYKVSRQIKQLKALDTLCDGLPFYHPMQRVLNNYLRGVSPLLEAYLSMLLARTVGFVDKSPGNMLRRVTRQRAATNQAWEQRLRFTNKFISLYPQFTPTSSVTKLFLAHLTEAWYCWRAGMSYDAIYSEMSDNIAHLIQDYVYERADMYLSSIEHIRDRLANNKWIFKVDHYRYRGRVGRQDMRELIFINKKYLYEPLSADTLIFWSTFYSMAYACIYTARNALGNPPLIAFPLQTYDYDNKILELALKDMQDEISATTLLTVTDRQLLTLIEKATSLPHEFLIRIKSILLKQRTFETVEVEYCEVRDRVYPIYLVHGIIRIVDVYLAQYLSYQIAMHPFYYLLFKRGFSSIDMTNPYSIELPIELTLRFCNHIYNTCASFVESKKQTGQAYYLVHIHIDINKYLQSVNLIIVRRVIGLLLDPILCSFIMSRLSASFCFKDMLYTAAQGVTPAFHFSHFLATLFLSLLDLAILLQCGDYEFTPELATEVFSFILSFSQKYSKLGAPLAQLWVRKAFVEKELDFSEYNLSLGQYKILSYVRNGESIYLVLRSMDALSGRAEEITPETLLASIPKLVRSFISLRCSSCNSHAFYTVPLLSSSIRFEFMGYLIQTKKFADLLMGDGLLTSISDAAILDFIYCANQIILSSSSTSFSKTVAKWNSLLLNCVLYYREALFRTPRLLRILMSYEEKICNKIKQGLNSKMPNRFPNVVFYSPQDLGGLGMLSIGSLGLFEGDEEIDPKYPAAERSYRWDQKRQGVLLPSLAHFITPWTREVLRSATGFKRLLAVFCKLHDERPNLLDLQREKRLHVYEYDARAILADVPISQIYEHFINKVDGFNLGVFRETLFQVLSEASDVSNNQSASSSKWYDSCIPRLTTLVHYIKDIPCISLRNPLSYHISKRMSSTMAMSLKTWYNKRFIGSLYDLQDYHKVMTLTFGGVEEILRNTLYPATNFDDHTSVVWSSTTEHEAGLVKRTTMTRARRQGLSQIPNRRFALWWSPTINRSSVYIGYRTQIDLMGVQMCGKLSTLKTAYVSLFRGHIWSMIHSSLVKTLTNILLESFQGLPFSGIAIETVHPRKSYNYHSSCGDIVVTWIKPLPIIDNFSLYVPGKWFTEKTHNDSKAQANSRCMNEGNQTDMNTCVWWIDLHLTWENIDTCDSLVQYAKQRHTYYTSDRSRGIYRSQHGILVCIDLLYRNLVVHGTVPVSAIRPLEAAALELSASLQSNVMMAALADRVRAQLGLSLSTTSRLTDITPSTFGDLFDTGTIIVDDSFAYNFKMQLRDGAHMSRNIINGFILLFNPQTGKLIISVVHASTYTGQSRRTTLSRWRTADFLMAYIASLPQNSRPSTIVVCNRPSLDPIKTLISNFTPPISVRGTSLRWCLGSIRYMMVCTEGPHGIIRGTVDEIVQIQTASTSLTIDLYAQFRCFDEYSGLLKEGTSIQHFIAILLMLRIVDFSPMELHRLISQSDISMKSTPLSFNDTYKSLLVMQDNGYSLEQLMNMLHFPEFVLLLPKSAYYNWSSVITSMTEKVVSEAAKKFNLAPDYLSPAEKRDLVLGAEPVITNVTERKTSIVTRMVLSNNILGERMLSVTQGKELVDKQADDLLKVAQRKAQYKTLQRNPLFQALFIAESAPFADDSSGHIPLIEQSLQGIVETKSEEYLVVGELADFITGFCNFNAQTQALVAFLFGLIHDISIGEGQKSIMEVREMRIYSCANDLFSYNTFLSTDLLENIRTMEEQTGFNCFGLFIDVSRIGPRLQELLKDGSLGDAIFGFSALFSDRKQSVITLFYFGNSLDKHQPIFRAYRFIAIQTEKDPGKVKAYRLRVHVATNYNLEFLYVDLIQQTEEEYNIDQLISSHICSQFTNLFNTERLLLEDW